jgi:hypothetical protein
MSHLSLLIWGQRDYHAELVFRLDGHLGLGHDQIWGYSAKALFSSWSSADVVILSAVSQLSLLQS